MKPFIKSGPGGLQIADVEYSSSIGLRNLSGVLFVFTTLTTEY